MVALSISLIGVCRLVFAPFAVTDLIRHSRIHRFLSVLQQSSPNSSLVSTSGWWQRACTLHTNLFSCLICVPDLGHVGQLLPVVFQLLLSGSHSLSSCFSLESFILSLAALICSTTQTFAVSALSSLSLVLDNPTSIPFVSCAVLSHTVECT